MKTFWGLFTFFSVLILLIFGIWGNTFEGFFNQEATQELLENASVLAGPAGVVLLVSDILLPIPTTVIIGAMGAALGPVAGAAWGWLGLTLAGWTGYGLARWGGSRWKRRLITQEEEARFGHFFDTRGGLAVVVSRMLPVLPEVLSIMAGLYGMTPFRFGVAVTLGSLPPALLFAWIGASAEEAPIQALVFLTGLTVLLWWVFLKVTRHPQSGKKD